LEVINNKAVIAVKSIEKMLLVHDGELDVEHLQAVYLTVGHVVQARQVCLYDTQSLHSFYQTAVLSQHRYCLLVYSVLCIMIIFYSCGRQANRPSVL